MLLRVERKVIRSIRLLSYGVALLSTALALVLTLWLYPWLRPNSTPLFFMAVMVSAWYGGLGSGLLSTALSTLAVNYFFIEPIYSLNITNPGTVIRLGVFMLAALLISGLNESRRIAIRREQTLRTVSEAAQEEAKATKERLETVLSSINDGFYLLDRDWRFIYVNDRYCEMVGMKQSAILGQNVWELFPSAVDTDAYVKFHQAISEQKPLRFDYFYAPWNCWHNHQIYPSPNGLMVFLADITEHKQAEATLRQSEARLRSVAANLPNAAVFIVDRDLRYLLAEGKAVEGAGMTPGDLVGKTLWEALDPNLAASYEPYFRQALGGEPYTLEHFSHNRHYISHGTPLYNAQGKVDAVLAISYDITDRKKVERERERFLAVGSDLQVITGCNGYFQWVSPTFERTLGWTPDEMISRPWTDFVHLDDISASISESAHLFSGNETFAFENRYRHKNGSYRWFLWKAQPYPEEQVIYGTAIDITERKQAERRLQESEARLKLAYQATRSGLWDWDIISNKAHVSQEYCVLFGLEPTTQEVSYERWLSLLHPDDRLPASEAVRRAVEQEQDYYESQYRVLHPDGIRWLASRGQVFYDATGKAVRMLGNVQDITDRKQAELQLQQRTSELLQLNASLAQTTAKLTERNQELDRFVYTVSHDLKAPLRAIYNLSQWIEDDLKGQLGEENQHQMGLLRQRVGRMEGLIDGLLVYSRVGRTEVATEKVNVGELLFEILDSLAPPPTFTISVQQGMPTLSSKKLLLSQVFSNLIINAIKHHDRPDGRIEIKATQKGDYYEFSVTDDGPGIASENHERVFGIFQTLRGKDVRESTGIGLSIVKKIIETEGGSIVLESELGKGATFRFTWLIY